MATKNKISNSLRNSIAAESKSLDQRANPTPQTAHTPATVAAAAKPATVAATATKKIIEAKKPAAKPATASAAKATSQRKNPVHKAAAHKSANTSHRTSTAKISELPEGFVANLAHTKLHHILETHYHLCKTCLENMQKVNDNFHDYFNQLIEINDLSALIKLNLSYLSSAPTRFQEMIAQNKNIFSDFFKFARPDDK
jgi:hypothetical protein